MELGDVEMVLDQKVGPWAVFFRHNRYKRVNYALIINGQKIGAAKADGKRMKGHVGRWQRDWYPQSRRVRDILVLTAFPHWTPPMNWNPDL